MQLLPFASARIHSLTFKVTAGIDYFVRSGFVGNKPVTKGICANNKYYSIRFPTHHIKKFFSRAQFNQAGKLALCNVFGMLMTHHTE